MDALKRYEKYVGQFGADFGENPSPGNKKGGLYNIYLKSSGVKAKGGTSIVEDLIDYGEWVGDRKGLFVHYSPGYDHWLTARFWEHGSERARYAAEGYKVVFGSTRDISDGIVEARSPADEEFGFARLETLLAEGAGGTAAALKERILTAWRAHTGGDEPEDDRTLLVLRVL